mgnify:CR=1 FL=1
MKLNSERKWKYAFIGSLAAFPFMVVVLIDLYDRYFQHKVFALEILVTILIPSLVPIATYQIWKKNKSQQTPSSK